MRKKLPGKKNSLDRTSRVLIVGCGDLGLRILPLLKAQFSIFAVTSQPERCAELRAAGAIPLIANLDEPWTLARLANIASRIIYLAPPTGEGLMDKRSRHLAAVLSRRCRVVYISTSSVYGDCDGALIDETHKLNPKNYRAVRRMDAENVWRSWVKKSAKNSVKYGGSGVSILRVPGIYAANRLPLDRIKNGAPALLSEQDVYTNHIHADDLARLAVQVLFHGLPNRIYHAVDDSCLLLGDYFDLVADRFKLPRAPRFARSDLISIISAEGLSFMSESRRLSNYRIKSELGFKLLYPTVATGLANKNR